MHHYEEEKKQELLKKMKELAKSYVPEWRLEEEKPDIGTALALIYADMIGKTASRFQKVMKKNQIAFINMLGASLSPAQPSRGYVTFSLVNKKIAGVMVPAKTRVMAESSDSETGFVSYETKNDLYVTPSFVNCIYETDDVRDYIGQCYDCKEAPKDIYLFETVAKNEQEHVLFLGHNDLFNLPGRAVITLEFLRKGEIPVEQDVIKNMAIAENVEILYSTSEGYVPFELAEEKEGKLVLLKGSHQPAFECRTLQELCSHWLFIRVKNLEPFRTFSYESVKLSVMASKCSPDFILANGEEADIRKFFPFGERLSVYNEVYITSEEVLTKKGAKIELSFFLSFASIPLAFNVENDPMKWKWVMDEADFVRPKEYDITIASVIWEYYNGYGWTKLLEGQEGSNVFLTGDTEGGRYVKLQFICPDDMVPVLVNSTVAHAIRARVTKVNNAFKMNGNYITPVMERTYFSYSYESYPKAPQYTVVKNNIDYDIHKGLLQTAFRPFVQMEDKYHTLYFGFDIPPKSGPIKLLFEFREAINRAEATLVWQYFNGHEWKNVNVIDETRNFSRTGVVTFMGNEDFKRKRLFGRELYWLKIMDSKDYYRNNDETEPVPHVTGMHMNSVKIQNREKVRTEYFRVNMYQKNLQFTLQKKNIVEIEVFVQARAEAFKKWERVEDFKHSGPCDKHFLVDASAGTITFGDGKNGCVPEASKAENVKVVYQCGGGAYTNVPAGAIRKLEHSIGFINKVYNPEQLTGGMDAETSDAALARCQRAIRHQNRCVTAQDYENLAYEAGRNVIQAKCFSGYNDKGEKSPGAISLVLLTRNYGTSASSFEAEKEEVLSYLNPRMNRALLQNKKFFVIEPVFVELKVTVNITVSDFNYVFTVKKEAETVLQHFLDPLLGNYQGRGWKIGELPNVIQIQNALHQVKNVTMIGNLVLNAYVQGILGPREIEYAKAREMKFVLPVSGKHEVNIEFM